MKDGQIAGSAKKQNIVRGDKTTWITEEEEQFPNTKLIINAVDRLVAYMRNGLYEYKICGRTPVSQFHNQRNCRKTLFFANIGAKIY